MPRWFDYRVLALTLVVVWGVVDTATTQFMIDVANAHHGDSHGIVRALVAEGMTVFWAVKLGTAALVGAVLLGVEPYIDGDDEHPRVAVAFKAMLVVWIVATLLLGPVSHFYVWANNGFPVCSSAVSCTTLF